MVSFYWFWWHHMLLIFFLSCVYFFLFYWINFSIHPLSSTHQLFYSFLLIFRFCLLFLSTKSPQVILFILVAPTSTSVQWLCPALYSEYQTWLNHQLRSELMFLEVILNNWLTVRLRLNVAHPLDSLYSCLCRISEWCVAARIPLKI